MSDIWTVTPAGTYRDELRADMDGLAGTSLTYAGSLPGAYTGAHAELAFRVDQGVSLALSALFLASAPRAVVVAKAIEAGLTPRAATFSRYIVQIAGDGELPEGTLFQGGGPLGRTRWEVVDDTATVVDGDDVTIQCTESGPITFTGLTDLTLVAPVAGLTGATYDPGEGDPFQVGDDEESLGSLRQRIRDRRSRGGSYASMASALTDLDWITAVDVRQGSGGAGTVAATVVPAPVGDDQEDELAATLYASAAMGATLEGASSLTTTDVNGQTTTVYYDTGTTSSVAIVIEVTSDGSVSDADLESAIVAAVESYFATLGPGDVAYYSRFVASVTSVSGVIGYTTLTLDGGTADITPALATTQLVPATPSVTVS